MKLTFVQPASFVADWRRLKLTDEDLQALETGLMERPDAGPVMSGTGGLRKMRFAPPSFHRGKSGSVRVCYVMFMAAARCYLLVIFPKNERPNLSDFDKSIWRKWITAKKRELEL